MKTDLKPQFNILFLGKNTNFTKEINRHLYSYRENINFNYKVIEEGIESNELLELNPKHIIIDFSDLNKVKQYEQLLLQYKNIHYPNHIYVFGASNTLTEETKQIMMNYGCSFIYELTSAMDEAFFLVKSIVLTINRKIAEKKELAAAKPNCSGIIKIPCFLSETYSSHFFIESNFKLQGEHILSIDNELIQNKIMYSHENLKILGSNYQFKSPYYKYRTKIKHDCIKTSELNDLTQDIISNSKIPLEDKNTSLNSMIIAHNNDKKQNYINWLKKNRITYDQDKDKRNVLLISKKNEIIKLKGKPSQSFLLYQLKSINKSNLNFIDKIKPSFVFYDLELPPKIDKYIENPTSDLDLYLDNLIDYNFVKNLTEVFFQILSNDLKTKVVIFNKTGIPDLDIKKAIGLDVLNSLNSNLNEKIITDYLDEFLTIEDLKSKKSKEKIIENSLYDEKEKFKVLNQESSVTFRSTDQVAKAMLSVDGSIELMTENQLLIKSKTELPCNELLILNSFISFNITVLDYLDKKSSGGDHLYHCIINGITSKERDFLRGYVITYDKDRIA